MSVFWKVRSLLPRLGKNIICSFVIEEKQKIFWTAILENLATAFAGATRKNNETQKPKQQKHLCEWNLVLCEGFSRYDLAHVVVADGDSVVIATRGRAYNGNDARLAGNTAEVTYTAVFLSLRHFGHLYEIALKLPVTFSFSDIFLMTEKGIMTELT